MMHQMIMNEFVEGTGIEEILLLLTMVKDDDARIAKDIGLEGDPSGIRSAEENKDMDYWIPKLREFIEKNRPEVVLDRPVPKTA